jgi:hypothetical protein
MEFKTNLGKDLNVNVYPIKEIMKLDILQKLKNQNQYIIIML